jgi:hypothetical protein
MASANIEMLKKTGNNAKSDECYTPKEALEPLLEFLDKGKIYYDCTSDKSSQLVDFLNEKGYRCLSSGSSNFLVDDIPNVDAIITNPPYSKKDKFIKKCYELGKPFALLLPVSSLQGQARGKMFSENGIEILTLNKRIDFTKKGSPHFGVAWFCHKILPRQLIFKG